MKLIIFFAIVAFAAARPDTLDGLEHEHHEHEDPVAILREESDPIDGANFRHEFEAENGISQSMVGSADENGAQVMSGSYSFPLPDGTIATFTWTADATGFHVESPLLPVAPVDPHPIPTHAQEQIDFSNAQQAAGLAWDQAAEAWI